VQAPSLKVSITIRPERHLLMQLFSFLTSAEPPYKSSKASKINSLCHSPSLEALISRVFTIALKHVANTEHLAAATFIPFSFTPNFDPNPDINLALPGVDDLRGKAFHFSERIHQLSVYTRPPSEILCLDAKNFPKGQVMVIDWQHEQVVLHETNKPCPPEARDTVENFKRFITTLPRVRVLMKPIVPMVIGIKFFLCQPIPPPPHWWIFGQHAVLNESPLTSSDPETPEIGNHVEAIFRLRHKGWLKHYPQSNSWNGTQMFTLPTISYYIDERQFEVMRNGILRREHHLQSLQQPKTCNGKYEFNLERFESDRMKADQCFSAFVKRRGDYQLVPPPPQGTFVEITLDTGRIWTAQVVDLGSRDPTRIDMIVIIPPSGHWFYYRSHSFSDPQPDVWRELAQGAGSGSEKPPARSQSVVQPFASAAGFGHLQPQPEPTCGTEGRGHV
ncbi:MAG: hypothetical protein Q9181_005952, partial [Wetmoreana brouardii]